MGRWFGRRKGTPYTMSDYGIIWRGTYSDWMSPDEAKYWIYHLLPFGWMIISDPPPKQPKGVTDD